MPAPMKDVEGKVAFITGGVSGIGLGIARAFTSAGMKVVITYRSPAHLEETMKFLQGAGDRVHAIQVDVTDRAGLENAAAETVRVFQKVHVIVNNAGIGLLGGLSTTSYEEWDWGMSVNATGVFNGIRAFLPHIQSHGEGGHIIATSSIAGLVGHAPAGVYTASKFAVVGMMEALRAELDGTNIGVTVFCPGLVNTNISDPYRNRPSTFSEASFHTDSEILRSVHSAMQQLKGPPPGMDPLEAGERVLRGMRNNDLYVLTSPDFEQELQARADAITASLPSDVSPPEARIALARILLGKTVYAQERDRKR